MIEEKIELGIRAAKLFKKLFPELWEHIEDDGYLRNRIGVSEDIYNCCKCGQWMSSCDYDRCGFRRNESLLKTCTVPDSLPINWENAMLLRDEIIDSHGESHWIYVCRKVWKSKGITATPKCATEIIFLCWWNGKSIPSDFIEAACIAKEREV